jgi:hypothetical protein
MRKEGKPHGKNPPQITMHKKKMRRNKKQLLSNRVLHSKKTSQLCKFVLVEYFVEDVDVCMDLMKYMHHLYVQTYPLYILAMSNIQIKFG